MLNNLFEFHLLSLEHVKRLLLAIQLKFYWFIFDCSNVASATRVLKVES